ncbi:MAG: DUF2807 domain-containing protein [Salegentibacter sp.]
MKNLFILALILISGKIFAQKIIETEEFRALDSNLGADIEVVPSSDYHLEISGNPEAFENFSYKISRHSLELRSKHEGVDFSKVSIKIFVPDIEAIRMSNGGKLTMDEGFSPMKNFVISVENNATADLSNIEFRNLVVNAEESTDVKYKSAKNLVSSSGEGRQVIISH